MIHSQKLLCTEEFNEALDIALHVYCSSPNPILELERVCRASWCLGAGGVVQWACPAAPVGLWGHHEHVVLGLLKLCWGIKIEALSSISPELSLPSILRHHNYEYKTFPPPKAHTPVNHQNLPQGLRKSLPETERTATIIEQLFGLRKFSTSFYEETTKQKMQLN